jgi:hypothetical protein
MALRGQWSNPMQVQVKMKTTVVCQYGTFKTGDVLRTDAAFAKHLVEDCSAAEYVTAPKQTEAPKQAEEKPQAAPVKKGRK